MAHAAVTGEAKPKKKMSHRLPRSLCLPTYAPLTRHPEQLRRSWRRVQGMATSSKTAPNFGYPARPSAQHLPPKARGAAMETATPGKTRRDLFHPRHHTTRSSRSRHSPARPPLPHAGRGLSPQHRIRHGPLPRARRGRRGRSGHSPGTGTVLTAGTLPPPPRCPLSSPHSPASPRHHPRAPASGLPRPRRGCPGPGGAEGPVRDGRPLALPEGLRVRLMTSSEKPPPPPPATLPFMLRPEGEVGSRGSRFRFLGRRRRRRAAPRSAGSCSPRPRRTAPPGDRAPLPAGQAAPGEGRRGPAPASARGARPSPPAGGPQRPCRERRRRYAPRRAVRPPGWGPGSCGGPRRRAAPSGPRTPPAVGCHPLGPGGTTQPPPAHRHLPLHPCRAPRRSPGWRGVSREG